MQEEKKKPSHCRGGCPGGCGTPGTSGPSPLPKSMSPFPPPPTLLRRRSRGRAQGGQRWWGSLGVGPPPPAATWGRGRGRRRAQRATPRGRGHGWVQHCRPVGGSGGVAAGGVLTVPVLPRERWPSCWARGATTEGWRGTAWSTAGASTAPCMAPSISKGGGQQEGWGEQGHGVGDTGGQGQQWDVGLRCAGWGPRGRAGGV